MKGNFAIAALFWAALLTVQSILLLYLPGGAWENGVPADMEWVRRFLLPFAGGIIIYDVAWWFKVSLDTRDKSGRR